MPWPTTSRQSRGYGHEWERTRKRILKRDNHLCQCEHCKADSLTRLATEVDHITSKAKAQAMGWSKERIEADDNLQSINSDCHKRKTQEEQGKTLKPKVRIGLDGWPVS
jgi:5-methylcytosine-specific restriction protein A